MKYFNLLKRSKEIDEELKTLKEEVRILTKSLNEDENIEKIKYLKNIIKRKNKIIKNLREDVKRLENK